MNESPFRPVPGFITLTDNGDGTGVIRIAPGANDRGNYSILAVATDDGDGLGDPISGGYLFNIEVVSENEAPVIAHIGDAVRSEEHTSAHQSLMRTSHAVVCLKKKKTHKK